MTQFYATVNTVSGCVTAYAAGYFGRADGTWTGGYAYNPNDGAHAYFTSALDFAYQPVGAPAGAEQFRLLTLAPACAIKTSAGSPPRARRRGA